MRTFIAVGLTDDIRSSIAGVQSEFRKHDLDVKYIKPENIHITLKFLGEVAEDKVDGVCENIKVSMEGFKKFNISVDSVGVFPGFKSPRVIWLGVSEGSGKLSGLNRSIEETFSSRGFEREKRIFSAHMTIGRVRSLKNVKLLARTVEGMSGLRIGRFLVEDVRIIKSDLTPEGPVYSVLKKVMLK